jgi:hypothetical protein
MDHAIPKRLIQTGKSRDLPLLEKAAATSLQLLNPDFEYLFFDDAQVERFIDEHFPQCRPVFDAFPVRIQRYDFFRYLAVYHYGGFYFDLDVFMAKGLHDLLDYGCVFPFEELTLHDFLRNAYGMDWEIGNYAFGARAGHPFIGAIIENCVKAQKEPDWPKPMWQSIPKMLQQEFYVLDTTGPGLVSRTLAESTATRVDVKVLFPENVCDTTSWHRFGNYGVHLQQGGWRQQKGLLRRYLTRQWESRQRSKFLHDSLRRGANRLLEFPQLT